MQQKIVLTLVVAAGNRAVSVDRIAEELWGDNRPPRWLAGIRTVANSLRRAARDPNLIYWTGRGYRLHRNAGAVRTDIDRMLQHAAAARAALADRRFDDVEREAVEALCCYGGGPWTTDLWFWGDLAADAYCLLGQALLAQEKYLRCIVELSRVPEELDEHDGVRSCLDRARQRLATTAASA